MKKNLLLYIILAFLILMNGFFLFNHLKGPHEEGRKPPRDFIVKELNFDAFQIEQFEKINREHHDNMRMISKEIRDIKDDLINRLSEVSIKSSEIDSISTLIASKEKLKEEEIFYNLRAIQELCNDDQKDKFLNIIKKARHRDGPEHKGPPR